MERDSLGVLLNKDRKCCGSQWRKSCVVGVETVFYVETVFVCCGRTGSDSDFKL